MALKDFMQKMQGMADMMTARREEGQRVPQNTMPNGSVSGYVPPATGRHGVRGATASRSRNTSAPQGTEFPQLQPSMPARPMAQSAGAQSAGANQPYGNQTTSQPMPPAKEGRMSEWFRRFKERNQPEETTQHNGTAPQPPVNNGNGVNQQPYSNAGQQPYGNAGQQSYSNAGQQPGFNGVNQQPVQPQMPVNNGYNPRHQSDAPMAGGYSQQNAYAQQPPQGTQPPMPRMPQQGAQPPVMPNVPQQKPQEPRILYVNTRPDEQGNTYALTLHMVQITSVASCYHLLEYMQEDEMVVVNAEQITDMAEASRCIDMLFGAATAMKLNFERISGKTIYLIAPRRVKMAPSDGMQSLNEADRANRWPGSSRARGQEAQHDAYRSGYDRRPAMPRQPQYADRGGYGSSGGRY